MAKRKETVVNTPMDNAFKGTGSRGVGHCGSHPLVTKVSLGEKNSATMTPTQTGGAATRPDRAGTKAYPYGRNST